MEVSTELVTRNVAKRNKKLRTLNNKTEERHKRWIEKFNIYLIRFLEEKNGRNGGEVIFEEITVVIFPTEQDRSTEIKIYSKN